MHSMIIFLLFLNTSIEALFFKDSKSNDPLEVGESFEKSQQLRKKSSFKQLSTSDLQRKTSEYCLSKGYPSEILVEINTDRYGAEMSWEIKKAPDGEVVLSGDDYESYASIYLRSCIDYGTYIFTIYDQYGDGFQSWYNRYRVYVDNSQVVYGSGNFGFSSSTTFSVKMPAPPPTNAPYYYYYDDYFFRYEYDDYYDEREKPHYDDFWPTPRPTPLSNRVPPAPAPYLEEEEWRPIFEGFWPTKAPVGRYPPTPYPFLERNDGFDDDSELIDHPPIFSPVGINFPSFFPPSPPSPSPTNTTKNESLPCSPELTKIVVNITTDSYPYETTWSLNISRSNLTIISGGPYSDQFYSYLHTTCLSDGRYVFKITDSYGDGLCCNNGFGGYNVTIGNMVLALGGSFQYSEEIFFDIKSNVIEKTKVPSTSPTIVSKETSPPWLTIPENITSTLPVDLPMIQPVKEILEPTQTNETDVAEKESTPPWLIEASNETSIPKIGEEKDASFPTASPSSAPFAIPDLEILPIDVILSPTARSSTSIPNVIIEPITSLPVPTVSTPESSASPTLATRERFAPTAPVIVTSAPFPIIPTSSSPNSGSDMRPFPPTIAPVIVTSAPFPFIPTSSSPNNGSDTRLFPPTIAPVIVTSAPFPFIPTSSSPISGSNTIPPPSVMGPTNKPSIQPFTPYPTEKAPSPYPTHSPPTLAPTQAKPTPYPTSLDPNTRPV